MQCEKTHIRVNMDFDRPFFGVIFSKGHYSDPNCVHLQVSFSMSGIGSLLYWVDLIITLRTSNTNVYWFYIKAGSGTVSTSFEVKLNQCGTVSSGTTNSNGQPNPAGSYVESTIIVQVTYIV